MAAVQTMKPQTETLRVISNSLCRCQRRANWSPLIVVADHGNILDMGGFELSQERDIGIWRLPLALLDSVTLAKGNHLDAYGDRFADIEYLHGMVEIRYISIGDHEVTAALLGIFYGTTASGEQVWFPDEIGDNVWVLVRRSDYWYD